MLKTNPRNNFASPFYKAFLIALLSLVGACDWHTEPKSAKMRQTDNPMQSALDRKVDTLVSAHMEKTGMVGLCIGILRGDSVTVYGYGETAKGNGKGGGGPFC
jgi:hypothetical protein